MNAPTTHRNNADRHVIVGLSGGVDSAVAAHLLCNAGFAVTGLFMKNWDEDDGTEYCTAKADLADAQAVAECLGIPLITANFAAEYWDNVFETFLAEYRANRTPNPDVLCNREIKFKQFAAYARSLGADHIATGHYVRAGWLGDEYALYKGIDPNKDQSYFLQAVTEPQLRDCLFPLGEYHKTQVRELAASLGLPNHAKKDSTGICFIGERRFADFLHRYLPHTPGPIRDTLGRTVGEHIGLAYYTLGQRQGLGIGGLAAHREAPWYVCDKRTGDNALIVTQDTEDLHATWLLAGQFNWLTRVSMPLECTVRIRYRQADQAANIAPAANGSYTVQFASPQRAVTPGQYVCVYQGERCIGGGIIEAYGRD